MLKKKSTWTKLLCICWPLVAIHFNQPHSVPQYVQIPTETLLIGSSWCLCAIYAESFVGDLKKFMTYSSMYPGHAFISTTPESTKCSQAACEMCDVSDLTKYYKNVLSLNTFLCSFQCVEQKLALFLAVKLHKRPKSLMFLVSFNAFAFFLKGSEYLWEACWINSQGASLLAKILKGILILKGYSCFFIFRGKGAKVQVTGHLTNVWLPNIQSLNSNEMLSRLC